MSSLEIEKYTSIMHSYPRINVKTSKANLAW